MDPEERTSQPLRVGKLEEEANMGPVPTGTPYAVEEFEAAVIVSRLCHRGALAKIVSHYGIDNKEILGRLAQMNDRSWDGVHGLGA